MNNKDSHCGMHTEKESVGKGERERATEQLHFVPWRYNKVVSLPACAGCLLLAYLPSESAAISVSHTQTHRHTHAHIVSYLLCVFTLYSNWLTLGNGIDGGSDVVIEQSNL